MSAPAVPAAVAGPLALAKWGFLAIFPCATMPNSLDVDIQELQRATRRACVETSIGWSMILRRSNSWRENGLAMSAKVKRCISWFPTVPQERHVRAMKFGTVAIIGRSNVGKSTLLNRLLNEKIAIVSDKPQTTRTRILGVVHAPGAQIALLDTPGLHKPQHLLNRRMVRTAVETLEEADILFVLMDATSLPGPGDLLVLDHVKAALKKRAAPGHSRPEQGRSCEQDEVASRDRDVCQVVCLDRGRAGVGPDGR